MIEVAITLGIAILAAAAGDILMSKGMRRIGVSVHRFSDIPPIVRRVITSGYVLAGAGVMAIYFAAFVAAMAWADVSVVVPFTALSYVITTVYSAFVMHERVNTRRWAGVALITVGAMLVGISS